MSESEGDFSALQKPVDVLEMWLGHRSPGDLQPQAWVTDDGLWAIRWFGDRPPVIMRIGSDND